MYIYIHIYIYIYRSILYYLKQVFFQPWDPGTLGAAAESSCSTSTAIPAEVGGFFLRQAAHSLDALRIEK